MSAPATRWEDVYATQTARITELGFIACEPRRPSHDWIIAWVSLRSLRWLAR